jgi:hypothetical protein
VATLDDLIERRLMLIFAPVLTRATLQSLAECFVATGRLEAGDVESVVERTRVRLKEHYGRNVI